MNETAGSRYISIDATVYDPNDIWFTADTHFHHDNIIKYCGRPFDSADEMDAEMIYKWNQVTGPTSVIFHLGDVVWGGYQLENLKDVAGRLNGTIFVVPGNHDSRWVDYMHKRNAASMSHYKVSTATNNELCLLAPVVTLRVKMFVPLRNHPLAPPSYEEDYMIDYVRVQLCHYPIADWDMRLHSTIHLHGHSHLTQYGDRFGEGFVYNVGVDLNDFRPISLVEVLGRVEYFREPIIKGLLDL